VLDSIQQVQLRLDKSDGILEGFQKTQTADMASVRAEIQPVKMAIKDSHDVIQNIQRVADTRNADEIVERQAIQASLHQSQGILKEVRKMQVADMSGVYSEMRSMLVTLSHTSGLIKSDQQQLSATIQKGAREEQVASILEAVQDFRREKPKIDFSEIVAAITSSAMVAETKAADQEKQACAQRERISYSIGELLSRLNDVPHSKSLHDSLEAVTSRVVEDKMLPIGELKTCLNNIPNLISDFRREGHDRSAEVAKYFSKISHALAELHESAREIQQRHGDVDVLPIIAAIESGVNTKLDFSPILAAIQESKLAVQIDYTPIICAIQQMQSRVDFTPIVTALQQQHAQVDTAPIITAIQQIQTQIDIRPVMEAIHQQGGFVSGMDLAPVMKAVQGHTADLEMIREELRQMKSEQ